MNIIEEIEREKNIKLSDSQLRACQCATSEGIKVITGGPGTGKTTFVDVLIRYFENLIIKLKFLYQLQQAVQHKILLPKQIMWHRQHIK